jgi:hypothetical protein
MPQIGGHLAVPGRAVSINHFSRSAPRGLWFLWFLWLLLSGLSDWCFTRAVCVCVFVCVCVLLTDE